MREFIIICVVLGWTFANAYFWYNRGFKKGHTQGMQFKVNFKKAIADNRSNKD